MAYTQLKKKKGLSCIYELISQVALECKELKTHKMHVIIFLSGY